MKTLRIAIELNHVVRDINKQIVKYYIKDFDHSLDEDEIDETDDVINNVIKFESSIEKNNFFYNDYPFELYGCAKVIEKNLATSINTWLLELLNIEDYKVEVFFYSMGESGITLQSTYFFLSKAGIRTRMMLFPTSMGEVTSQCDVVITSSKKTVDEIKSQKDAKKIILIKRKMNEGYSDKVDYEYDNLSDFLKDGVILENLCK